MSILSRRLPAAAIPITAFSMSTSVPLRLRQNDNVFPCVRRSPVIATAEISPEFNPLDIPFRFSFGEIDISDHERRWITL